MNIDINDYLSEEEKKEICAAALREAASRRAEKDFERILSNAGYETVTKAVNKHFNGDMEKIVIKNTLKVLNDLSSYSVFKKPDVWDKTSSTGWDILQKSVTDNTQIIEDRVKQILSDISEDYLRDQIETTVADAIISVIKGV